MPQTYVEWRSRSIEIEMNVVGSGSLDLRIGSTVRETAVVPWRRRGDCRGVFRGVALGRRAISELPVAADVGAKFNATVSAFTSLLIDLS